MHGGGKGERESWRESPERARLGRGSFPFLRTTLPVRAQEPGKLQPEAAVSHSEGFHSCAGPELCVIQKLSKTMAIPPRKISFSVSVLLSITVLFRNTAAGNPGEAKKKKKESSRGMWLQVLVEVACGVPAFKKAKHPALTQQWSQ